MDGDEVPRLIVSRSVGDGVDVAIWRGPNGKYTVEICREGRDDTITLYSIKVVDAMRRALCTARNYIRRADRDRVRTSRRHRRPSEKSEQ